MPKKLIPSIDKNLDQIFDQNAGEVSATTHGAISGTTVQAQLEELETEKQAVSEKGAANGYASLDGSGDVPISQLPDAVLGGPTFQGTWNANTNSPDLSALSPTQGHYYRVSVAGTTNLDGITDWGVGDWAIYNGTAWDKIDNSEAVTSVNGATGAVTLDTDDISEGATNLYHTTTRARTAAVVNSLAGSETDQAPSVSATNIALTAKVDDTEVGAANGVGSLDANAKQPLSEVAIKPNIEIIGGGTKTWLEPDSYADASLLTSGSGDTDSGATIAYNATYHNQTNNISQNVWFKTSNANSEVGTIYAHSGYNSPEDRKWWMYMLNGQLNVLVTDDGWASANGKIYTSVNTFNDNQWHMFTFTFTTDTLRIYVDGVELTVGASTLTQTQNDTVNSLFSSTSPVVLGAVWRTNDSSPALAFDGNTAQFSYWDKQLTPAEITELYSLGKAWDISGHSASANLVMHVPVSGSETTTLAEVINSQNATLVGTASVDAANFPPSNCRFEFSSPLYVEVAGLSYSDNTIPATESPIILPNDQSVAYAVPNTATGGGNLSVVIDTLDNVPAGAITLARRDGVDIVLGSSQRYPAADRIVNKVQTKILSADVTTDGAVAGISFSGLTIGKWYEITGNIVFVLDDTASDSSVGMDILNGAAVIVNKSFQIAESVDTVVDAISLGVCVKFLATSSTLTCSLGGASANSYLQGDGTRTNTFITIEERNDLQETTDFT